MSIETVIAQLDEATRTGVPCAPIRPLLADGDVDAAYEIQARMIDARVTNGEHIVGRKIGLTSPVVQEQLGVDQPDFGTLFANMMYSDEEPIALDSLLQPRVEAEVAFVLGKNIDHPAPSIVDVIRATEFVLPAIEVVDCWHRELGHFDCRYCRRQRIMRCRRARYSAPQTRQA